MDNFNILSQKESRVFTIIADYNDYVERIEDFDFSQSIGINDSLSYSRFNDYFI